MIPHMDNVGQLIVDLKNESEYVKKDEHLKVIPKKADDLLSKQVFLYCGLDRKPVIFNPANCVCIELNDVKFMSMLARRFRRLQDSDTPVIDLIERNMIYPFILIINGRFIPWESINLISSYGKYYFFIHDLPSMDFTRLVRTVNTMNLIILPTNIIYSIGVPTDDLDPIFSFDDMGLFVEDNWTHCIYYPRGSLGWIKLPLTNDITFSWREDASYKFFNENFFFWTSDGLYDQEAYMNILAGYIDPQTSGYNSICVAVYNKDMSVTIDNLNKVVYAEVKSDLTTILNGGEAPKYATELVKPFELTMDRNLTYEENRAKAIEYILSYRTDLFYELYEYNLDFFTLPVEYSWLCEHIDENGYLSLPRRSSKGSDYSIIMMVNCELYEYYKHHFYDANKFICPVSGITELDTIELLFFRNISDFAFEATFTEGEYLPLDPKYFNKDTKLFSKFTTDTYFEFPAEGNHHFPIPYSYEEDENGNRTVVMDPAYYGKTVTVASDKPFRYYGYHVNDEEAQFYKMNLGKAFYYCYDYDRYMVFHNGRRLSNSQYRLTVPCRTSTPFTEFEIYLAIPLAANDRLDIFYLPNKIRDIEGALTLNSDGTLVVEKSMLEYISGKGLYTFWINGCKVPLINMEDFNTTTIQLLTDGISLKNAVITKMGDGIDEVEEIYQAIDEPIWDKALNAHSNAYRLTGFKTVRINNSEADIYDNAVPIVSIMWELIREHYIANAFVDTTTSFIYDYLDQDQTAFDGYDQAGNAIIDAMNAERRDNLDVERYYP